MAINATSEISHLSYRFLEYYPSEFSALLLLWNMIKTTATADNISPPNNPSNKAIQVKRNQMCADKIQPSKTILSCKNQIWKSLYGSRNYSSKSALSSSRLILKPFTISALTYVKSARHRSAGNYPAIKRMIAENQICNKTILHSWNFMYTYI